MAFDLDTQDIRDATQSANDGSLFFLLVATPNNPPKSFHKNLVQPYLYERGWKKISYKNTGFRALYFFHDEQNDSNANCISSVKRKCARCRDSSSAEKNEEEPAVKKSKRNTTVLKPTLCDGCDSWTAQQRASYDRNGLKNKVSEFKRIHGGSFDVHIVLSKPVDDEEEFLEIASQPGATEY